MEKEKEDFKDCHLGAGDGMSEPMIEYVDMGHYSIKSGASIPSSREVTVRTISINSYSR